MSGSSSRKKRIFWRALQNPLELLYREQKFPYFTRAKPWAAASSYILADQKIRSEAETNFKELTTDYTRYEELNTSTLPTEWHCGFFLHTWYWRCEYFKMNHFATTNLTSKYITALESKSELLLYERKYWKHNLIEDQIRQCDITLV